MKKYTLETRVFTFNTALKHDKNLPNHLCYSINVLKDPFNIFNDFKTEIRNYMIEEIKNLTNISSEENLYIKITDKGINLYINKTLESALSSNKVGLQTEGAFAHIVCNKLGSVVACDEVIARNGLDSSQCSIFTSVTKTEEVESEEEEE